MFMLVSALMLSSQRVLGRFLLLAPLTIPNIIDFSSEFSCMIWPKEVSRSLVILTSNDNPGFMGSSTSLFVILSVSGIRNSFCRRHISNASIRFLSAIVCVQLSHPYIIMEKTMALTSLLLVVSLISLLFQILFMPVIAVRPNAILRLASGVDLPPQSIFDPGKIKS